MSTIVERISAAWLVHKREPLANAADLGWPTKDAPFALRAKHESRPRRKTVFDGLRASLVGGLVNKFPVRLKCTAARFAPFVGPDTKSLTASRKRPLRGLHERSGFRRRRRPSDFVDIRVGRSPFRVRRGGAPDWARQWRVLAWGLAHWRMGGPCRTAAQPPSADAGFRVSRGAPVAYPPWRPTVADDSSPSRLSWSPAGHKAFCAAKTRQVSVFIPRFFEDKAAK